MLRAAFIAVLFASAPAIAWVGRLAAATPKQWKVRYETHACTSQVLTQKVEELQYHLGKPGVAIKLWRPFSDFCITLHPSDAVMGETWWFTGFVRVRRNGDPTNYLVGGDKLDAVAANTQDRLPWSTFFP
jgi:hypothetical protein